jgi:two-component system, chemotaxis family, sensor kinase CheA
VAEPNHPNDDFINQFLDDYFTECEEHLTLVRRALLNLEQFVDKAQLDTGQLDELFRAFHTIKGISGMVGLSPAEQLAHEMESYLRVLRQGNVVLTKLGFEALLNGTRTLGEIIASHRAHHPLPDITTAVQSIAEAINEATAETNDEPRPEAKPSDRSGSEKRKWRFLFEPSQDRSQAGINVNTIRSRLQSIGEILQATPIVEKGEVVFEFVVATAHTENEFTDLDELGLTIFPVEEDRASPIQQQAAVSSSTAQPSTTSVRVDLVRLDQLMLLVGELVVTRARLEQNLNAIRTSVPSSNWRQLQEVHTAFGKQLRDLRKDVMRVRMVPIAEVFERMRFVVRDVARETRKQVAIELTGQETEIDKFLVERLADPLLHLVRNAISHGIESESERLAAGKASQGHIWLSAKTEGEIVVIEIADDGRGIDLENIQAKAPEPELKHEDGRIDFNRLLDVITAPGFSTRDEADRASGRGVGMDIVARGIRELDGQLSLHTEPGVGTTFRLELPLTLAITDALVSVVDGQTFAIHRSNVHEVIEIDPQSISVLENNEVIVHRNEVLPLVRLSHIFNLRDKRDGMLHAFVIGTGSRATALVVDKILGLREVVVRSLNDPLTNVRGVGGATELGDGRPILILDVSEILDATRQPSVSQKA